MKNWFFLLLLNCCFITAVLAQPQRERIEALKKEFLAKKLDLTSDEAAKFWPVYNNYRKEMGDAYHERRQKRGGHGWGNNLSPNTELAFETRILNLKKKYQKEFSEVLPAQKVEQFYMAEREFREQLIKQLKHRNNE